MDLQQIIHALKAAAKTVQEIKNGAPQIIPRSGTRDSIESLLEQFCHRNKLQWHRDAIGNSRNSFIGHIHADFFRLDITVAGGVIGDVTVLHQLRGPLAHPETLPHITRALRLKDMSEFETQIHGMLKMYTTAPDRSKKGQFFISLTALENDLTLIQQQLTQYCQEPLSLIRSGPFGLMVPRVEGVPYSLGFFLAPVDLFEKNGAVIKKDYQVIVGRRIGLWASVLVRFVKGMQTRLQSTSLGPHWYQTGDGRLVGDYAITPETGVGHDVPGYYVLILDEPMILLESALHDIKQITDLIVQPSSKSAGSTGYVRALRLTSLPEQKELDQYVFRVTLPGQHHTYALHSHDLAVMTVSEIPFTHPSHIPPLLNVLRRQATLNQLIGSCMRTSAENEVCDPFLFDVTVTSARLVSIAFRHPLNSTSSTVRIHLDEFGIPSCQFADNSPRLCRDQQASIWLNKTLSIPVTLKTAIDRFVASYVTPTECHRMSELTRRLSVPAPCPPIVVPTPPDVAFLLATESPIPSPSVVKEIKTEPTVHSLTSHVSAVASPVRSSKIERMLKEGRSSSSLAKERNEMAFAMDIPMDLDLHKQKMKELYEPNPKKKLRKQEAGKDYSELDDITETRPKKARAALTPPGSVPTAIRSDSLDALDAQPKSEPTLATVRAHKSVDSPHGSPTTLKLKIAKQPTGLEFKVVSKDPPVKKKKTKVQDAVIVEPKPVGPKTEPAKKGVKRDVFEFDGGSEHKKIKTETVEVVTIPEQHKKIKKEQPAEVQFLPNLKAGVNQKSALLAELGASMQRKNNPSLPPATKTSPVKTAASASVSPNQTRPPAIPLLNTPKFPISQVAHHLSKPPNKDAPLLSKAPHGGNSVGVAGAKAPTSKGPAVPVVSVTPTPMFNMPKAPNAPNMSLLGKIPKKAQGGISVVPPTSVAVPIKSGLPEGLSGVSVAAVKTLSAASTDLDENSALRSTVAAGAPHGSGNGRTALLPTPTVSVQIEQPPLITWTPFGTTTALPGDKKESEKILLPASVSPNRPILPTPVKPPLTVKPPSFFRQVVGILPESELTSPDDVGTTRKPSPDVTETVTSPTVKRPGRTLSTILDRLTSINKHRLDSTDTGSHDSSDLPDVSLPALPSVSSEIPERMDTTASSDMPQSEPPPMVPVTDAPPPPVIPPVTKTTSSLQMLVPYSSDDDGSCDESAKLESTSTVPAPPAGAVDTTTQSKLLPLPQSPEITTGRAAVTTTTTVTVTSVKEPEVVSVTEISPSLLVTDIGTDLVSRLSEDRTSPVILDDALLDEAFFPSN